MPHIYYPCFDDIHTRNHDLKIFNIKTYQDLCKILSDNHITHPDEYNRLRDMYLTLKPNHIQSRHPDNIQDFFKTPNREIIQTIYTMWFHHNNKYISTISNLDYYKIDELTIDHINLLYAKTTEEKNHIMDDIVWKISDQIYLLQEKITDIHKKDEYTKSYISHLMTIIPNCMMKLTLWQWNQEKLNDTTYNNLQDMISQHREQYNDFIILLITNPDQAAHLDWDHKNVIISKLTQYHELMTMQYHELIAYICNRWVVMMNTLPDLLFAMIQNQYVIETLQEHEDK